MSIPDGGVAMNYQKNRMGGQQKAALQFFTICGHCLGPIIPEMHTF